MAYLLPPTISSSQYPSNGKHIPPLQPIIGQPNAFYLPLSQNGSLPSSPVFYNAHQHNLSAVQPITSRSTPGLPASPQQHPSTFQAASRSILPNYFFPVMNNPYTKPQIGLNPSLLQSTNQTNRLEPPTFVEFDKNELSSIKNRNAYVAALTRQKTSYVKSYQDITPSIQWQGSQLLPGENKDSEGGSSSRRTLMNSGIKNSENETTATKPYLYLANVLGNHLEAPQLSSHRRHRSNRPSISILKNPEEGEMPGIDAPRSLKHLHSLKFKETKNFLAEMRREDNKSVDPMKNNELKLEEPPMFNNNRNIQKGMPVYKYDEMFNATRKSKSIRPSVERELSENKEGSAEESKKGHYNLGIRKPIETPLTDRRIARFNVALGEFPNKDLQFKELTNFAMAAKGHKRSNTNEFGNAMNSENLLKSRSRPTSSKKVKSSVKLPPVGSQNVINNETKKPKKGLRMTQKTQEKQDTEQFENELSEVILFEEFERDETNQEDKHLTDILKDLDALDTLPT